MEDNNTLTASTATDNAVNRSASTASTKVYDNGGLSRGGTLKKKQSLKNRGSIIRSNSKKSYSRASMRASPGDSSSDEYNSVFHTPIPTTGNPTEVLADRFQAWRKLLKDLITYFREVQASYEHRSKALLKLSSVLNSTPAPSVFLSEGGLDDAARTLRAYHKHSVSEANKAKDIEDDVITQLSGLRSDLSQKIKEIKSLSGDFKNSVEREKDSTRKAVASLKDALATAETDPVIPSGKGDPFIVRLAVDKQVEKQIEEENYLHRAYLNLEGSGRELESIVVGEIQKAYNAYAGILKREADSAYGTIEELRTGPITMAKDLEWQAFVHNNTHFVNPDMAPRHLQSIHYPGKFAPAATEIRAGMLERKSKYLKSYTPGWYVLSPTYLHEFKSADHIHTQQPVMSLCLLDQKLGSRSQDEASSHKFSLKGRQSGGMHRGHSWVFRAESYDTMLAWYDDMHALTEKTGAERKEFVRRHARSVSGADSAPSISSDGIEEDEADAVPYAAAVPAPQPELLQPPPRRPSPGGRFPSDVNVNRFRDLPAPASPSGSSHNGELDDVASTSIPKKDDTHQPRHSNSADTIGPEAKPPAVAAAISAAPEPAQEQLHELAADTPKQPSALDGAGIENKDWGAPATGGAVVGAGALEHPKKEGTLADVPESAKPAVDAAAPAFAPASESLESKEDAPSTATAPAPSDTEAEQSSNSPSKEHALRPTGHLFPSVLRHDTAMTISELHVPGEWKAANAAAGAAPEIEP